jgi:hypothetical protein
VPCDPQRALRRNLRAADGADVYGHFERAERRREAELMEGVFGV